MTFVDERLLPTEADVRFYEENGYWLGPKILTDEEIDRLTRAMDDVYAGIYETGREPWKGGWVARKGGPLDIRKTDNSYWANNTIRKLTLSPVLGAIAS